MKIKALRPLNGHYGQKSPGEEFDVGEALGKNLVERGLAEKVKGPAPRRGLAEKVENKAASGPLAGSPTGGGAPASSSAPGRASGTSRSRPRATAPRSSS
jgi:hypothetical protein